MSLALTLLFRPKWSSLHALRLVEMTNEDGTLQSDTAVTSIPLFTNYVLTSAKLTIINHINCTSYHLFVLFYSNPVLPQCSVPLKQ